MNFYIGIIDNFRLQTAKLARYRLQNIDMWYKKLGRFLSGLKRKEEILGR